MQSLLDVATQRQRQRPLRIRADRGGPGEPHEARPQRDRPRPAQPAARTAGEAPGAPGLVPGEHEDGAAAASASGAAIFRSARSDELGGADRREYEPASAIWRN